MDIYGHPDLAIIKEGKMRKLLVLAVVVLLALSVPFAFAVERLLVGSTNIYRQIAWFSGIFIVTFFLVFIFFTMVEMSLTCSEERVNIMVPQCQVIPDRGADLVLGVVLVVVLGLELFPKVVDCDVSG